MSSIARFSMKLGVTRQQHLLLGGMRRTTTSVIGRFQENLSATQTLQYSNSKSAITNIVRNATTTTRDTYEEKKKALKAIRTQRFEDREARKERVKRRRDGKPKNVRKKKFEAWFLQKKKFEEINNHKAKKLGMDWKINVAVVLERLPIVLPDKPQWEKDYETLRAYLNQFGRTYPPSLLGEHEIEDLEDLSDEAMIEKHLPRGYTPAPRETEADASGDVRTLDRRLKTWVYLTVKDSEQWQCPTIEVKEDETLLEAAKRAIKDKIGEQLEIYYPSNCPMAVDMQVYSTEERAQHNMYGEKTFFMVVQYDEGSITKNEIAADDFAWLEKSEFVERVKEQQGEDKSELYQYLLTS